MIPSRALAMGRTRNGRSVSAAASSTGTGGGGGPVDPFVRAVLGAIGPETVLDDAYQGALQAKARYEAGTDAGFVALYEAALAECEGYLLLTPTQFRLKSAHELGLDKSSLTPIRRVGACMMNLAVMGVAEGREEFLELALDQLLNVCGVYGNWQAPGGSTEPNREWYGPKTIHPLSAAITGGYAGFAHSVLRMASGRIGGFIYSAANRSTATLSIRDKCLFWYRSNVNFLEPEYGGQKVQNHAPVRASGTARAALAVAQDLAGSPLLDDVLTIARKVMEKEASFATLANGVGWNESPLYGFFGGGYVVDFVASLVDLGLDVAAWMPQTASLAERFLDFFVGNLSTDGQCFIWGDSGMWSDIYTRTSGSHVYGPIEWPCLFAGGWLGQARFTAVGRLFAEMDQAPPDFPYSMAARALVRPGAWDLAATTSLDGAPASWAFTDGSTVMRPNGHGKAIVGVVAGDNYDNHSRIGQRGHFGIYAGGIWWALSHCGSANDLTGARADPNANTLKLDSGGESNLGRGTRIVADVAGDLPYAHLDLSAAGQDNFERHERRVEVLAHDAATDAVAVLITDTFTLQRSDTVRWNVVTGADRFPSGATLSLEQGGKLAAFRIVKTPVSANWSTGALTTFSYGYPSNTASRQHVLALLSGSYTVAVLFTFDPDDVLPDLSAAIAAISPLY